MRRIYLAVFALLFFTYAYASDDLVIKVGMKLEDAQKMLQQAGAKKTALERSCLKPDCSDVHDYEIPDQRIVTITYDENDKYVVGITVCDLIEMDNFIKKYRAMNLDVLFKGRFIKVEKINLREDELRKYIAKADSEAENIIEEFKNSEAAKNLKFPPLLIHYDVSIKEDIKDNRKVLQISYQAPQADFRGHPQHFEIWVYEDNLDTKIFKGV